MPFANFDWAWDDRYDQMKARIDRLKFVQPPPGSGQHLILLDVQHFQPKDLQVSMADGYIYVRGTHPERQDKNGWVERSFKRRIKIPNDAAIDSFESHLSADGILTIRAENKPQFDESTDVYRSIVSVQLFIKFEKWHWHRRWEHICEGVIVTRSIVLTACRCMMDSKNPSKAREPACKTRVEAGNENLNTYNKFRQVRRVREFIPHPKCGLTVLPDQSQWHHDVGLMVLQYDLIFNQQIKPAQLFNKKLINNDIQDTMDALYDLEEQEAQCFSSGWLIKSADKHENNDPDEEGLQQPRKRNDVKIHLLYPESCKQRLCSASKEFCSRYDEYDPICGFRLGSVCSEVSGGPLFCEGSFFGTVSNRTGCGTEKPLVFTNLKPILELIQEYELKYRHKGFRRPPGYIACKEEEAEIEEVQPKKDDEDDDNEKNEKQDVLNRTRSSIFDKLKKEIHKKAESLKKKREKGRYN